ncbi:MAG: DUF47 family protein [Magnetococcales bacterium]|nr:DUF47 family protein [Magnetococcales bacterium]
MSEAEVSESMMSKFKSAIFPGIPDFYALLVEQCELQVETTAHLVAYMKNQSPEEEEIIAALEKKGDVLKNRNLTLLGSTFSTSLDREDIRRAALSIDMVTNYCKTTIREMQVLGVKPDDHMVDMVQALHEGAMLLRDGYRHLRPGDPNQEASVVEAQQVMKTERSIEKLYRRALSTLFTAKEAFQAFADKAADANIQGISRIFEIFKRREIYRHLSNAGDQLANAGFVLRDIAVQTL